MKSYLLIDRSGSMSGQWDEVLGGLDTYCKDLPEKDKVCVRVFDNEHDLIFDGKAKKFSAKDDLLMHGPRGMTALYDAIGLLDIQLSKDAKKKCQIVIATDGFENASHEQNAVTVRKIIKGWEAKGYDVIWLGAQFADIDAMTVAMGVDQAKVVNIVKASSHNHTMAAVARRKAHYASGDLSYKDDLGADIRGNASK